MVQALKPTVDFFTATHPIRKIYQLGMLSREQIQGNTHPVLHPQSDRKSINEGRRYNNLFHITVATKKNSIEILKFHEQGKVNKAINKITTFIHSAG